MPEIVIQLGGPDLQHRSRQLSSQILRGLYLEQNPDPTQPPVILSFPGKKALSTGAGVDRGMHVMGETLYKVSGTTLESIASSGSRTSLGTIPGINRASMADDGTNLYIVANGVIYHWDGSTLGTVTQSAVTNPVTIDYLNRQFFIAGDNGLFGVSDVADGTTYNALNYAEAEASPDSLIAIRIFKQLAYMFGLKSVEVWYNSGIGNPPVDRQDTSLINIGCAARFSIAQSKNFMYWLGDDNQVYKAVGASAAVVSDVGVHSAISAMTTVSDAIGVVEIIEGHVIYFLTFPTADKTFFYDENLNYWGTLSYGMFGGRDLTNSYAYCYRKHLVADYRNGNVYELDKDTYTDAGDAILRRRATLPIEGNGHDIILNEMKLIADMGNGLATGQGSDPIVMVEISRDRARTWESLEWESMGVMGDYERVVQWNALGRAKTFTFALSFTDPVPFHAYKLVLQVDYGR